MIILSISLIKDLLRAWKVLGCHYLKSGNSLDETHREEISQPAVKRKLGESSPAKLYLRQHVPEIRDFRLVPVTGGTLKLVPYLNIINIFIFFNFKLTENRSAVGSISILLRIISIFLCCVQDLIGNSRRLNYHKEHIRKLMLQTASGSVVYH